MVKFHFDRLLILLIGAGITSIACDIVNAPDYVAIGLGFTWGVFFMISHPVFDVEEK